ncbi:tripartite tricarboxylate transporter substrate binding protein [Ramlibacter sp. MAHUQ-53]|uniref:tripartite tricarboxylate transporter substrate binding protein n=1 Tax=unclassified Ramlibacter TaxID=2617605 RepID=UPI00362A83DB
MLRPALPHRRHLLAAALLALAAPLALAQPQADRPLRLVVPLTTGSTVDAIARTISAPLAKATGHPVVVENLPGAGGMTGTLQVVKAARDGMTLALVSSNHVINPAIYKTVLFDHMNDITPIAVVGAVPLVLVVHPSVPAKNTAELVALMKAQPGKLNYGSAGNGSTLHLAAEMLASETGTDIRHIPYKGTGPLTTDLVGGQVQMAFVSVTAAAPQVRAGKLRAIAVSTKQRSAVLPEVPTLAETGLPGYAFEPWIAMVGPAGLPARVVQDTYANLRKAMAEPVVQEAMAAQGISLVDIAPAQAPAFFRSELDKHAKLVKRSGATLD